MSEKRVIGEAGDHVKLADTDGGFTDPATGFDISRDQVAELTDPVGERTMQAILSGGLLIVDAPKKKSGSKGAEE